MSGRIDSGRPELDELRSVPRDVPPEPGRRIGVAAALILAAFVAIMARLVALQVVQGPEMRSLSEHNRIRLVRVPAARGVVYDRNGELLIDNRASFDVIFVPEDAREAGAGAPAVLRTLASYLREPGGAGGGGGGAPAGAVEGAALGGHGEARRPGGAGGRGAGAPSARSAGGVVASGPPPLLPVRAPGGASSRLRGGGERERAGEGD